MQGGTVEVGVRDDHVLADLAEDQPEVHHHGGLALAGQRAGDHDAPHGDVAPEQLDLHPEPPEGLHEEEVLLLAHVVGLALRRS